MTADAREPCCEQAARALVETMRESRLCLLYGTPDARRRALIEDSLVPLLRQGGTAARRDIVIQFSAWHLSPLPVLRMLIDGALSDAWSDEELAGNPLIDQLAAYARSQHPGDTLAHRIGALHQRFGVRFLFVFDDFEEFLDAPRDREDLARFQREFVEAVDRGGLAANFLIAAREDAAPLLKRLRRRIAGFDEHSFRLLEHHDDTAAVVPLPRGVDASWQRGALRHSPVTADEVYQMIEAVLVQTAKPIAGPWRDRGAIPSAMPGNASSP
jgi:hypothetical protein